MSKADLKVDWATHEAAKYAVENWHYSRCMPKSKLVKIGAWEIEKFIGVVIFGVGATPELCKPYRLQSNEVCELVRVALTNHNCQTSRIIAMAMKLLKQSNPGLKLVVSFADSDQGHHGGIYQAGGWVYSGDWFGRYIETNGKREHPRTLGLRYGVGGQSLPWLRKHVDPNARIVEAGAKHRYLMPLDHEMRAKIAPLAKPYPKRPQQAMAGAHPAQRQCDTDPDAPSPAADMA